MIYLENDKIYTITIITNENGKRTIKKLINETDINAIIDNIVEKQYSPVKKVMH